MKIAKKCDLSAIVDVLPALLRVYLRAQAVIARVVPHADPARAATGYAGTTAS